LVDSLSKVLGNKKTKTMNKKKSNSKFFSQNQFV
jgi:hypothetical protein